MKKITKKMNHILSQQFNKVCTDFQGFVTNGNQGIQVKFPKRQDLTFFVRYSQNFPIQAPQVFCNNNNVSTVFPIIVNWISLYTLSDVVNQIKEYTEIPVPKNLFVNRGEIEQTFNRANPMDIANPSKRQQIFNEIPSIKEALTMKSSADAKIKEMNASIQRRKDAIMTQNNEIMFYYNQQNQNQQKIGYMQTNKPQMQREFFLRKAQEENAKAEKLLKDFKAKQIKAKDFVQMYREARQEENKCKIIADEVIKYGC